MCEIAGRWSVAKIDVRNLQPDAPAGKSSDSNTTSRPCSQDLFLVNSSVTFRLPGFVVSRKDGQAPAAPPVPIADSAVSDEAVMAQICDGNREALAVLFRRYARLVRTVAVRILRDDSEADDLLQDVFLFIHRNCRIFDASRAPARSWIVQMTYHRAIDRRRYLQFASLLHAARPGWGHGPLGSTVREQGRRRFISRAGRKYDHAGASRHPHAKTSVIL